MEKEYKTTRIKRNMETAKHIKKNCSVSLVKSMCNNEIGFQKNIVNYLNQKENTLDSF